MTSASRHTRLGSFVFECTTVTVQFSFINNIAAGMPTMFDRPTTTAFFPLSSTPERFKSSMHPFGVHGTNKGSCPFIANFPMFSGWNPSTSFSIEISANTRYSFTPSEAATARECRARSRRR